MSHTDDTGDSQQARELVQRKVIDWLFDAVWHFGFISGLLDTSKERGAIPFGDHFQGSALEYEWVDWNGIRIRIQLRLRDHRLDNLEFSSPRDPFELYFGRKPPIKLELFHSDVEELIEVLLPGIHRVNTWAVCELQASKRCEGKEGRKSVCIDIEGKKACWPCKERCGQHPNRATNKEYDGFVYLLGNKERRIYKIGVSGEPKTRSKGVNTLLPFTVLVMHEIGADDSYKAEKILHGWFTKKRVHGEWFELSEDDVRFISSLVEFENGKFKDESGRQISEGDSSA